jgi:hypothetical protein
VKALLPRVPQEPAEQDPAVSIVVLFLGLGPFAGLVGFMISFYVIAIIDILNGAGPSLEKLLNAPTILIIGIPFAYMFGIVPALLAGLSVAIFFGFMRRVPWHLALLIGLCVGAAFSLATGHTLMLGSGRTYRAWDHHLVTVLPCVVATLVCWAAMRRQLAPRNRQGMS